MEKDEQELHEKFVDYGRNAKEWMRKCVLLLPEIDRWRIWEKKGFGSIFEYAAKLAGMSRNTVNEALRIMERVGDKPELKEVIGEKGIWAVKPVVNVATEETVKFWAAKAREMPQHTLEVFVRDFRRRAAAIDVAGNCDKIILSLDLSRGLACEFEKLKGENWDETVEEFLKLRRDKLMHDRPEVVRARSRFIPAAIEGFILKRSNKKCEFPLCKRDYRVLHHADRFSLVHVHDPDRIFALCREHHDLAHRGLIANENLDVRYWKIREKPDRIDDRFEIDQKVLARINNYRRS